MDKPNLRWFLMAEAKAIAAQLTMLREQQQKLEQRQLEIWTDLAHLTETERKT